MTNRSGDWNGVALANGRYQINARLGAGGMGAVYRAMDRNLDAEVVIKVPYQSMLEDPDFSGRFAREIRSLVKLSHPRIVKVTDVGDWDGAPFAVMQFLPGGSLEDRQQFGPDGSGLPCDPREVPKWLIGIAQALDYVHSQGYIHRDVKPGNILFDAQGHSFLSDFGVAKVLSETSESRSSRSMTGAGKVLGTPEYMAPELIMGEKVDGRVDQYALAITVYELLCGRRPFEGEGEIKTKVLVLHSTTPPPPLLAWQPGLTSKLSEAVLKGLAKDPNGRYPSCTALAAAVVAAVKELPARQEDRVRIQCPACGKGLAVPAADFARLRQTGRRVPCPACQEPIQVSGEPAGTTRSGTMIVTNSSGSGDFPAAQPSTLRSGTMIVTNADAASAPQAAAGRRGTMIVNNTDASPAAPAAVQRSGTMIVNNQPGTPAAQAPAAPRSGTMIVTNSDAPPAAPAAGPKRSGTMIVSNPEGSGEYPIMLEAEPVRLAAVPISAPTTPNAPAATGASSGLPPQVWIAGGVGAGVALIALLAYFALAPRGDTKAAVATASPQPRVVPTSPPQKAETTTVPVPRPKPIVKSIPSVPPVEVAAANVPASFPTPTPLPRQNFPPSRPMIGGNMPPANSLGGGDPDTPESESTMTKPDAAGTETGPIAASRVAGPKEEWSPLIASKKPTRAKETLDKILTSAARFQNQLVVPEGMYCLEDRVQNLPGGGLQIGVSQSRVELARNGAPSVRTLNAIDLDVEPKLAGELSEARRSQKEPLSISPALLTVWVTSGGVCRLVKVEFLVRFQPRYNPNGVPDVDYFTLKVSPDGISPDKANDDDWETLPRMLNIKNVCERQLKARKNAKLGMQQAQIDSQMNSMFSSMMRSAAIQSARDEAMLQRLRNGR
ncbi:MAG: protein kinase [Isosphaeraceae bacterium]|nr:protein kinase [Isosphaeraceae bacterium]